VAWRVALHPHTAAGPRQFATGDAAFPRLLAVQLRALFSSRTQGRTTRHPGPLQHNDGTRQGYDLEANLAAIRSRRRFQASETARVRDELLALADSWRQVLTDDPEHARPVVAKLLEERVIITLGAKPKTWTMSGRGSLRGLFEAEIFPSGWRPQRDSIWFPVEGGCRAA
jgi:hypothetical protein